MQKDVSACALPLFSHRHKCRTLSDLCGCAFDQVFTCGGIDYTSFSDVKDAFVGGKLDEQTLKAALVDAVNKLLDPVRKHFR